MQDDLGIDFTGGIHHPGDQIKVVDHRFDGAETHQQTFTIGLPLPPRFSRRAAVVRDVLHGNNGFAVVFKNAHARRCYVDPGQIARCGPDAVAMKGVRERTRSAFDMPGRIAEANGLHHDRDIVFGRNQRPDDSGRRVDDEIGPPVSGTLHQVVGQLLLST